MGALPLYPLFPTGSGIQNKHVFNEQTMDLEPGSNLSPKNLNKGLYKLSDLHKR